MASSGVPDILETEVSIAGTSAGSSQCSVPDCRDGCPTAEWTLQQLRECVTGEEPYKFFIHDRDSSYSKDLDASITSLGLKVMKTPYRTPQANSFCERLIGTIRRECMDFIIPLHEAHIHQVLKDWTAHFN